MRSRGGWFTIVSCLFLLDCGGATTGANESGTGGAKNPSTGGSSAVSCSPGTERCDCYGNGTCDRDLTCASGLCVKIPEAATGGEPAAIDVMGGALATGGVATTVTGGAVVTPAATGGRGSGGTVQSGGAATGGYATNVTIAGRPVTGGSTAVGIVGNGGIQAVAGSTSGTGGAVMACQGVPASEAAALGGASTCNGTSIEAERLPVDVVTLMDRSISNSYAVGTDAATAAAAGQTTRWQVLMAAMQGLATLPEAQDLGVSITFFSLDGGNSESTNCEASRYVTPVVPLGALQANGAQIVTAMQNIAPAGLTPTVPALTGAFLYAMSAKRADPTREKVVVLISDGFPTQCALKSPSDIVNVIQEAAAAPTPIRTFIIGVGSPNKMISAKFNLQNYARAGNTGKPPYVLDESAGAAAMQQQLITTLLNIAGSSIACEYAVEPPVSGWVVEPEQIRLTYQPNAGVLQEIPRVASAATCPSSVRGGWYFDSPVNPTKVTACPCTCAGFGAGQVNLIYGCRAPIYID